MRIGLDIGYSSTKWLRGMGRGIFPSVVGNLQEARFTVDRGVPSKSIVLFDGDGQWLVGDAAVLQSSLVARREDRAWIESAEYRRLWQAALSEVTAGSRVDLQIVTGLPVTYFSDRDVLRTRFLGELRVARQGRGTQRLTVRDLIVMPQPFGSLLGVCLDKNGRIVNRSIAEGRVGIMDVGGKTTGFLSVDKLQEIRRETHSIDVGCWQALRLIGEGIDRQWPGLGLRDHEIAEAVRVGSVLYFGEAQDIGGIIEEAVAPLAAQVLATATQRWNGGARLDAVLVTGGGAHLVGVEIKKAFRHAQVLVDPVFANVTGFYRFAQRKWG